MEFYLIRHTTPAAAPGICYGRTDLPLAASAEQDIKRAITPLPRFDRIYSSPAQRCTKLADVLSRRDACELILEPALSELDFGEWEQLPWSSIPREHSDPWAADTWHRAPPGGETEQALWSRVSTWYATAIARPVARCAIVAHGGPLRVLRCLILNLPMEQRWEWSLAWGEHVRFEPSGST
ncbi:MAG: alpha-ribazole phosphatase family protein [Steroidobacter sp.]